ncbi:light-dependent protochlorophyllide reductase [Synechococcus sp. BIOS-E4-1]|uniref:SDR family NAD(P)-dependent oxidoreductase n=1 Tax=Synechococcus sp. BIOS-E4-1 TaxID=1400864 RepID=UPI0016492FC0|nr:SDR family NAD(P)-dependent oxidoreductase [Synechococcus sp. BIOS-E4-1]QNI53901.1 light-dependent protochlorophyllide reductase [Synechococcus sp. BIOS-E4-1]
MADPASQRVLLTGGNSGVGFEAAKVLSVQGHELTILCRNQATADQTLSQLTGSSRALICDLADLDAVDAVCAQLLESGTALDALVLNAGLQYAGASEAQFSAQGIELTFAVNQLAHQLMAMRLLPLLRKAARPRVVITASEVHNPSSGAGKVGKSADLGELEGLRAGAGFAMLNGSPGFDGNKAYKDSKLCNVLMARELVRQLDGVMPVIAWSPGLVITRNSGGFFRYNKRGNPLGMGVFAFVARDLLRITESPENAGRLLAQLVNDPEITPGFSYFTNKVVSFGGHRLEPTDTSVEGADLRKAEELWQLSEQLIGHSLSR